LPFTLCLDVTLRVAAVPAAAQTAARLQDDFDRLAARGEHWAFRYVRAAAEGDELIVRGLLLEPVEDLYDADPDAHGDQLATDVLLRLLNAHSGAWRALEVGDRRIRSSTQRVRRRFWTPRLDDRAESPGGGGGGR
jgi:hypothetical protein